jgi:hypothetical protein
MNGLIWLANHPLWGNVTEYPDKLESRYIRGTRESALYRNLQNSGRAPTLDRTRAWKTLSKPNWFRQSFRARATSWTVDKLESLLTLRISHLSLLYKEWTWEHYRKLNLTFFTLFAGRTMWVFIEGLSQRFGWKWGSGGGALVMPTGQLGWSGGHVS